MRYPNLFQERKLAKMGFNRIAGLDEAGRGPLAGPVVAAAVLINFQIPISNSQLPLKNVKDSKRLSPKQREKIFETVVKMKTVEWGIGRVSEKVIDRINILQAAKLAMKRALKNLERKQGRVEFLILDGNMFLNDIDCRQMAIVKADQKVFSCALASIIAKVSRDRMMLRYHQKYPNYCFDQHKGYGTKNHLKMLEKHGPCPIHRMSFQPLKSRTGQDRIE